MKNIIIKIFIIGLIFSSNLVYGQGMSKTLGFDFGTQLDFIVLNYQQITRDFINNRTPINVEFDRTYHTTINALSTNLNGSLLGNWISGEKSNFYFGDYIEYGQGIGISNIYTPESAYYNDPEKQEKKVCWLINVNLGLAAALRINSHTVVGLRWVGLGENLFLDFNSNPRISQTMNFYPTFQYKKIWLQAGFGSRTININQFKYLYGKPPDFYARSRTFSTELRIATNVDLDRFVSMKFQKHAYKATQNNQEIDVDLSTVSIGFVIVH